ncbi:hypothetical protein DCAR_0209003 [Daucus carota subsp. sativus]|uniref:Uncharacterized protein n=1 Tax=Daucus carota subsp. sativus TaxID=79200 RepID=A0A161XIW9_DAUCS|nr:hypothetical protein DCAR_0209003 [Daucus carota subsp. sativus]
MVMSIVHYVSLLLGSIYAAGNTVPIPFLKATDISPIALLSNNVLGCRDSGEILLWKQCRSSLQVMAI